MYQVKLEKGFTLSECSLKWSNIMNWAYRHFHTSHKERVKACLEINNDRIYLIKR